MPELETKKLQRGVRAETNFFQRMTSWTRFIVFVPVLGLFFGSVILTAVTAVDMVGVVVGIFTEHPDAKHLAVQMVEIADVFLLAIVLYIMSLGFYELFIDSSLVLPGWLHFHGLEDLKEKLVGVVVVVLSVFFLGKVIEATDDYLQVLWLGLGIGVVTLALGYFVSVALHVSEEPEEALEEDVA